MIDYVANFFQSVFSVSINGTLLDLLIVQANSILDQYGLTDEQKKLCTVLYVACQVSGPPYNVLPPNQVVSNMHVKDYSVGFQTLIAGAIGTGFCDALQMLLRQFGIQNGKMCRMIVR